MSVDVKVMALLRYGAYHGEIPAKLMAEITDFSLSQSVDRYRPGDEALDHIEDHLLSEVMKNFSDEAKTRIMGHFEEFLLRHLTVAYAVGAYAALEQEEFEKGN